MCWAYEDCWREFLGVGTLSSFPEFRKGQVSEEDGSLSQRFLQASALPAIGAWTRPVDRGSEPVGALGPPWVPALSQLSAPSSGTWGLRIRCWALRPLPDAAPQAAGTQVKFEFLLNSLRLTCAFPPPELLCSSWEVSWP